MSRSTVTKSRTDKGKDKDRGGKESAPTPSVSNDVVPGRFTENDWFGLLAREETDDFIQDVLENMLANAMSAVYQSYIGKQLLPYTITQAKEAVLQIVQWQFLTVDKGELEPESDTTWREEEEPVAAPTDSWSQGSVPSRCVAPPSVEFEEKPSAAIVIDQTEVEEQQLDTIDETEQTPSSAPEEEAAQRPPSPPLAPQPGPPAKRRAKYKPNRGALKSAGLRLLTKTLRESEEELAQQERVLDEAPLIDEEEGGRTGRRNHSDLKLQAGRPPGNKNVLYDSEGNVLSVARITSDKLPSHSVRTQFTVVDPDVEATQNRLVAMRTGRFNAPTSSSTVSPPGNNNNNTNAHNKKHDGNHGNQIAPIPPPLIESMSVARGVVVREAGRVKKGPKQSFRQIDSIQGSAQRTLKPLITASKLTRSITVQDILITSTPVVKPFEVVQPVPPIQKRQCQPIS